MCNSSRLSKEKREWDVYTNAVIVQDTALNNSQPIYAIFCGSRDIDSRFFPFIRKLDQDDFNKTVQIDSDGV